MSLACQVAHGVEVAVPHQRAVRLAAHDDAVEAGVDQEAAVGEPAQPGRLAVEVNLDPALAVRRDGEDGVVEEVRVPQAAVVPARAFPEEQARQERLGGQGLARHGAPPLPG